MRADPIGRAYAGSAIGNGQIFYWGGGHGSYPGNDVDLYDIATNRWIPDSVMPLCWAPCCLPSTSPASTCDNYPTNCNTGSNEPYTASCLYGSCIINSGSAPSKPAFQCSGGTRNGQTCSTNADCAGGTCPVRLPTPGSVCTTCRPYTEHTYQRQVYNPARGKFLVYAGSGTWEWTPVTRTWAWLGLPPANAGDIASRLMLYDPVRARPVWFKVGGNDVGVYTFSYTTNTWTLVDSYLPTGNHQYDTFGTWDGRANKFIISFNASPRFFVYDPARTGASAWMEITSTTPVDLTAAYCPFQSAPQPCFAAALTYDATNQRTIVLGQDPGRRSALWAYDALANTWQKVTTSNAPTTRWNAGYPNMLHYDAVTGALFFVDVEGDWTFGPGSIVKTMKVRLDLGNPLPPNTPTNTVPIPTATKTQPTATPTIAPPVPPTSTPGGPTPTCAGTVRRVGPGRTYTKPSQAAAAVQTNDCVYIDAGFYPNDVAIWPASADNILISGVGGMTMLEIQNGVVAGSKGIWVVAGDNTTIENIGFACATSRTLNPYCSGVLAGDNNDAAIRLEAPGTTIRNCKFRDNDNGILGGPISGVSGTLLVEHSEFFRNGFGDGFTHNLYVSERHAEVVFRYNYSHGTIVGHNFKSRAQVNHVLYNRLMDEQAWTSDCTDPGTCSASVQIELPCGGRAYVIGNVVHKAATADSVEMVKFRAEQGSPSCTPAYSVQELRVVNNTFVSGLGGTTQYIRGFGASSLWAINNIMFGGGALINWPAPGTVVQNLANVSADPNLLSPATFDYHLRATSTAVINQGIAPGIDPHGVNLVPVSHYVYDRSFTTRPSDAILDVGAFEYVAGTTPFPTPTATPSHTPSIAPTWTPTPATPVFCSAGQREAVFSVIAGPDDGVVERSGTNYANLQPSYLSAGRYDNSYNPTQRNNGSGNYKTGVALWRWNTTTLPDGSAWPPGATVVDARLRPWWTGGGSGPRSLVFEWHAWPPPTPLSQNNWTNSSPATVDPTFAGTSPRPTGNGRQTIALSNAATNITPGLWTGIRMMVTDTTPPALGEENFASVFPRDYVRFDGERSTQLVVCYVIGPVPTPQPPSPPHLL